MAGGNMVRLKPDTTHGMPAEAGDDVWLAATWSG
jgi:hypothetical protein